MKIIEVKTSAKFKFQNIENAIYAMQPTRRYSKKRNIKITHDKYIKFMIQLYK